MKYFNCLICTFIFALCSFHDASCIPTPQASNTSPKLISDYGSAPAPTVPIGGPGDFVSVNKTSNVFNINGTTQYFAGTNTWWLAYTYENSDIDKVLGEIAKSGLLVTRIWGFGNTNDASTTEGTFFQELKGGKQSLNFDPATGIPRLDYVISKAEALKVKLIIPLLNGNDDLGGINTYASAYSTTKTDFFTSNASQTAYLTYVDFIVNRYKSSPAIFSWEICNEPRCPGCQTSVITQWATDVSKHIKSIDSKHLVSLGDEGWFAPPMQAPAGANNYPYQGGEGVDFKANLAIPDIDFGTFHMYPEPWKETDEWGNTYIQEHADVARAAGKPVIMEEYGTTRGDRVKTLQKWQQTVINGAVAGDTFWQFEESLSRGFKPVGDGLGISYSESVGSDYEVLVTRHAKAMGGKKVGGYLSSGR
ncbi:MAG: hypothetical protein L6R41_005068 [Letrouitia leprolyta]|nr:MAG: hypothetical protein L6R41_005068 [Letrouitia leprolyta]